jgi:hypothetical protein
VDVVSLRPTDENSDGAFEAAHIIANTMVKTYCGHQITKKEMSQLKSQNYFRHWDNTERRFEWAIQILVIAK